MGTSAKSIIDIDRNELIELLNKALADEWLAYYQYWIGSKVIKGSMSKAVQLELIEHATEELAHAELLVDRIMELDGTPILNPAEWFKRTNCGYTTPESFTSEELLKQNIEGERCAINVYNNLLKLTKDKDDITFQLILGILKDELKHEDDLEKLLEDLNS